MLMVWRIELGGDEDAVGWRLPGRVSAEREDAREPHLDLYEAAPTLQRGHGRREISHK